MKNPLTLFRCRLKEFDLPLLWNGRAWADWKASGLDFEAVDALDPHALAYILHITSREALAAMTSYGYQAPEGKLPTLEELEGYFSGPAALPWELTEAVGTVAEAISCGNHRDYQPKEGGPEIVDLSDQELKKN